MLKPLVAAGPTYQVQLYPHGTCEILGRYAYHNLDKDRNHRYSLYIGVIRGNGHTIVVDAGMADADEMNRGAGFLMSEVISQAPGQDTLSIMEQAGVKPEDVDMILLTHFHYDHCSNIHLFPNATVTVPARAWKVWHEDAERVRYLHAGLLDELEALQAKGQLRLLEDEELIAPGLGVIWVGGHSPCSQLISVNTEKGVALLCGDAVQLFGNIERNDIIHIYEDGHEDECWHTLEVARAEADLLVPGHDPRVMERYPGGVIGA